MHDERKVMQEGKPFMIVWEIPDNTTLQTFDFDTSTYDGEAGFFENKMLWISAIKIVPGGGSTEFSYVDLDDVLFWLTITAGDALDLSGEGVATFPMANIQSKYGVPFIPIRNKMTAKHSVNDGASYIKIWGLYTERTG